MACPSKRNCPLVDFKSPPLVPTFCLVLTELSVSFGVSEVSRPPSLFASKDCTSASHQQGAKMTPSSLRVLQKGTFAAPCASHPPRPGTNPSGQRPHQSPSPWRCPPTSSSRCLFVFHNLNSFPFDPALLVRLPPTPGQSPRRGAGGLVALEGGDLGQLCVRVPRPLSLSSSLGVHPHQGELHA